MKHLTANRGFSLLELMTAIAVVGVLLAFAIPSLTALVRASRISGSSRDLVVDFAMARNEAVSRATRVTVCTSTNMVSCDNSSWNAGRLIFIDGGAVGVIDGTDAILSRTPALDSSITTTAAGDAVTSFYVTYTASGRLANTGTITVCAPGQQQRVVSIHRSGAADLNRTTTAC